jgi:hypothetical protein
MANLLPPSLIDNVSHAMTLDVNGNPSPHPLNLDSSGALWVTGSLSTVAVISGTFLPNVAVTNFPPIQFIYGDVNAFTSGPQGISGSVNVFTSGPQSVSGTVSTLPIGGTSVYTSGIQAVSGSIVVSSIPAANVYTSGLQGISGSVSVANFPANQPVTLTNWPATVGVSGSVSISNFPQAGGTNVYTSGLQGISGSVSVANFPVNQSTTITNWPAVIGVSGTFVSTPGPTNVYTSGLQGISGSVALTNWPAVIGISGTVSTTPFTGGLNVYTSGAQLVSGAVNINNLPVNQPTTITNWPAIIGVSGTLTSISGPSYTSGPQAVTGSVNVYTSGPQGISGTVSTLPIGGTSVYTSGIQAVSGSVALTNWPAIIGVSGTLTSTPGSSYTSGPQAVTGSVNVYTSGLQGISGSVSAAITNWPAVIGISGTVATTGQSGGTNVYTSGLQGISGSVALTNWPATINVSGSVSTTPPTGGTSVYTSGPQNVSGSVAITNWPATVGVSGSVSISNLPQAGGTNVYTSGLQGISGSVNIFTSGLQGISGTVSTLPIGGTSVYTSGPQAVSGSVGATITNWPAIIGVSGTLTSITGPSYTSGPQSVTGSVNVFTSGLQGISGSVSAAITNWPATINVSGSVSTTPPTGGTSVYTSGPQAVSGSVFVTQQGTVGVSGSVNLLLTTQDYYPNPIEVVPTIGTTLYSDPSGNLMTRGTVLTDELGFRDSFFGSSLESSIGTCTFTNGSTSVTGTGTSFLSTVQQYQYVKLSSDFDFYLTQVASVQSNTSLTLVSGYPGGTLTNPGSVSNWFIAATSGLVSVASSNLIVSGTVSGGNNTVVARSLDYAPIQLFVTAQYVPGLATAANQYAYFGLQDSYSSPQTQITVQIDSTLATNQIRLVTAGSSATSETLSQVLTLPTGFLNTQSLVYKISLTQTAVSLEVAPPNTAQFTLLAFVNTRIPNAYTTLYGVIGVNTLGNVTTSASLVVDIVYVANQNRVEVASGYGGEPLSIGAAIKTSGQVATAADQSIVVQVSPNTPPLTIAGTVPGTSLPLAISAATTGGNNELFFANKREYDMLDLLNTNIQLMLDMLIQIIPNPVTKTHSVIGFVASTPYQYVVGTTPVGIYAGGECKQIRIQNTGTTKIYLAFNGQTPTSTAYHLALSAGSAANDGTGGTYFDDVALGQITAISSAAGGTVVVTVIN